MATYSYEIAPVKTKDRAERSALLVTGTVVAVSYGTATQEVSRIAAEKSKETGIEYGVVRLY